jgi:Schlafen, AlbA_2
MLSITRGSIGDLDDAGFRHLVRDGEHLFVERKQQRPDRGFGPTVASFANMLGGWLLIGVLDKPAPGQDPICGWSPSTGEPQQLLTQQLRQEVDPLPLFAAKELTIDGKIVWAVRVFPSDITPHIVLGTGAVYVRTTDGKQPIKDAATLLSLADRGREAARHARERIEQPGFMPLLSEVFAHLPYPRTGDDPVPEVAMSYIVRAIPVSVDPGFADRVLCERGYEQSDRHSRELQRPFEHGPAHLQSRQPMIRRRGFVFDGRAHSGGHPHLFRWVTDAGGGIGVRVQTWPHSTPGAHSAVFARTVRDDLFKPILTALARDLEAKGAYVRCLLHVHIDGIFGSMLHPAHGGGGGIIAESPIQLGGELVIPADASEIDAQTHAWAAELERAGNCRSFSPRSA